MLTALLLAAAGPLPADGGARYPLAEILVEARRACGRSALPALPAGASFGDWSPFLPQPDGWLASYMARNVADAGAMEAAPTTYRKTVAGRSLVAFVARLEFSFAPGAAVFTCEVFDPEAPPMALGAITTWARRPARRASGETEGIVYALWQPGLGRGIEETIISWMPSAPPGLSARGHPGLRYSAVGRTNSRRK